MTTITFSIAEERMAKLQEMASRLHIPTEDLIRAGIEDLIAQPDRAFERAAQYVLEKNDELYRRLA